MSLSDIALNFVPLKEQDRSVTICRKLVDDSAQPKADGDFRVNLPEHEGDEEWRLFSMFRHQRKKAALDSPDDEKGKVYIRTRFGEVAAGGYFPALSEADMIEDEQCRKEAGVEGGPFCYTDAERLMPF